MKDINEARWEWLNTRNKDIFTECFWRMERLVKMADLELRDSIWTEKFEVTFNNKHEEIMLVKYLEGAGYKVELDYGDDATKLTLLIRIGI